MMKTIFSRIEIETLPFLTVHVQEFYRNTEEKRVVTSLAIRNFNAADMEKCTY